MKVSKVVTSKGTTAPKKAGKTPPADSTFADSLQGTKSTAGPTGAVDAGSVGHVDAILAVQEAPDALDGRSRGLMQEYGTDLLDLLDDLRLGILAGSYPKEKLAALAQKLRQKRQKSDDPRLNELIEEIELRTEVEIAKLTRDVGKN